MSLSWRIRNAGLWFTNAILATIVCIGIPWISNWLQSVDDSSEIPPPTKIATKFMKKLETLDSPTEEQLVRASTINLQRMNPPKPFPPPEKPVVVTASPQPVSTILFQGKLLGTFEDSDPKYCFAILKGTDERFKLVAKGQCIDDKANSATLIAIHAKEVTIQLGEQVQTLKVQEEK